MSQNRDYSQITFVDGLDSELMTNINNGPMVSERIRKPILLVVRRLEQVDVYFVYYRLYYPFEEVCKPHLVFRKNTGFNVADYKQQVYLELDVCLHV